MKKWIACTIGADKRVDYVSDLPGCDVRVKNGTCCGYGFTLDYKKAIPITDREWDHFSRQCRSLKKPAYCIPV